MENEIRKRSILIFDGGLLEEERKKNETATAENGNVSMWDVITYVK